MEIFNGRYLFENNRPIVDNTFIDQINESVSQDFSKQQVQDKFYKLGLYEAEQIIAITNTPERIQNLSESLAISESLITGLVNKCKSELAEKSDFYKQDVYQRKLGAYIGSPSQLLTESFGTNDFIKVPSGDTTIDNKIDTLISQLNSPISLPKNLDFINFIPFVKDQFDHPTCAAFAATCSNEFRLAYTINNFLKGYIALSEASLYCEAKKIDGLNYQDGTKLSCIAEVLSKVGQAKSTLYPYDSFNQTICQNHSYYSLLNSSDLINHRAGSISINPQSTNALRIAINNKYLPFVGIKLYDSIWNSRTNETGFVNMPLNNETMIGGHAISLVGFFEDSKLPGGGAFIFKNSWGQSWAFNSIFNRSGFGIVPYEYVEKYCYEAYVLV